VRRGALLAAAGAALAMVACGDSSGGSPDTGVPASSAPAPGGIGAPNDTSPQPFTLFTKCGVTFTDFQKVTWYADPQLVDASGGPPPGFGNPTDRGTMQRVSTHEADYVSSSGRKVVFHDTLVPGASPPGLCQ
jgi:hypothetical protein